MALSTSSVKFSPFPSSRRASCSKVGVGGADVGGTGVGSGNLITGSQKVGGSE